MESMSNLSLQFLQKSPFYTFFLPLLLLLVFLFKYLCTRSTHGRKLPPSPPTLPIIGNLHQLGSLPHRSLRSLSRRYGELMLLHMGSKPTLIVSSSNTARKFMKTYDKIFSNRPKLSISRRILYDGKDIAFACYGEYWRQMRGICVTQLLSNKKVQCFRKIREEEANLMVETIKKTCSFEVINLREIIMQFTNNVICRACFGRKYSSDDKEGKKFTKLLNHTMKLIGEFSLDDCIPWLGWIDRMRGLKEEVEKVAKGLDEILEKVIEENQNHRTSDDNDFNGEMEDEVNNFVEILLELQKQNKDALPMDSIKAVILDMFAAGTDTTSTLIEWTIVELIRHPKLMKEVQAEIRRIVKGNKVCEDDLEKMMHLKAVIKETLRLHPPAPLLVIRESSQQVKLNGFDIVAGTQVIINAWAIQRDPVFWEEAEEFRPERFLKNNLIDFNGQDFEIISFGGGRRICPGISFGMAKAELVIATLMYEFDWKLPGGMNVELDMTEEAGLTVRLRDSPMVIATPYVCS